MTIAGVTPIALHTAERRIIYLRKDEENEMYSLGMTRILEGRWVDGPGIS